MLERGYFKNIHSYGLCIITEIKIAQHTSLVHNIVVQHCYLVIYYCFCNLHGQRSVIFRCYMKRRQSFLGAWDTSASAKQKHRSISYAALVNRTLVSLLKMTVQFQGLQASTRLPAGDRFSAVSNTVFSI